MSHKSIEVELQKLLTQISQDLKVIDYCKIKKFYLDNDEELSVIRVLDPLIDDLRDLNEKVIRARDEL